MSCRKSNKRTINDIHRGAVLPKALKLQTNNNNDKLSVFTKDLCYFCFDILQNKLAGTKITMDIKIKDSYPLFVSWHDTESHSLRGCIGTFSSSNLRHGLKEYALKSAFEDSRFNPISSNEISGLTCSVSILIDFENGNNWNDWIIGLHGIKIEFENEYGHLKTATYLPEVANDRSYFDYFTN